MQKSFSFKGLTYNSDNLLVADGECMELVNLRYRDGALFPIPTGGQESVLESVYCRIYWHPASEMYLAIENSDELPVHFYDKNLKIVTSAASPDELMLFPLLKGVERIEFSGNIVCCIAASTIYYLIYDADKYRWLGERPSMPSLTFSVDSIVYSLKTDGSYLLLPALDNINDPLYWCNASLGFFDECLAELHSKGYFVDRALFRFAFRLYDGSYLYYSPIYYVDDDNSVAGLARDAHNFTAEAIDTGNGNVVSSSRYQVKVQGFKPSFHFKDIDLKAWENIIVAIDVFTSGSIYGHKVAETADKWNLRNGAYYSNERGNRRYVKKDNSELLSDVTNAAMFYKIAEYNIDGVLVDSVKNVSASGLALCDNMPDEDSPAVARSAASSYRFNGRLHLAGMREQLFKGYNSRDYLPSAMESALATYAIVYTKIKTSMGMSVVKREYDGTFALGVKDGTHYITPYLMYPDSRACETTFVIETGSVVYRKTFALTPHKTLNLAAYVHSYGDGCTVTLVSGLSDGSQPILLSAENVKAFFSYTPGEYVIRYFEGKGWYYGDLEFTARGGAEYTPLISTLNPVDGDTITIVIEQGDVLANVLDIRDIAIDSSWEVLPQIPQVDEVNPCEVRGNVMKVSAVDNPFYFPAKNTYVPSQEDILALCSNTVALSQGQFGQHPLYVFCKDGIWAMAVDTSGNITYVAAYPLSREVCINSSSLCSIDSGVVFVAKKGVMLLQGGKLTCLSASLDSNEMPIEDMTPSSIFYKIAMLSYNTSAVGRILFKEYIKSAVIGYLASEKEIWVSNPRYEYTYVLSLENGCWTKVNRSYACFVNCYPNLVANTYVDDKSYISMLQNDNSKGYAPVLLVTRPQLWGTKLPKRIMQLMLHASVKMTAQNAPYEYAGLGCYLLCSNDGVHFKLLCGVENERDFNDVVFPFFPTQSYKYYVIALSGAISADSRVVGAELSIECVWNNRLR